MTKTYTDLRCLVGGAEPVPPRLLEKRGNSLDPVLQVGGTAATLPRQRLEDECGERWEHGDRRDEKSETRDCHERCASDSATQGEYEQNLERAYEYSRARESDQKANPDHAVTDPREPFPAVLCIQQP